MVHPVGINALQKHYAFHLTHNLASELFFSLLIELECLILEGFCNVLCFKLVEFVNGVSEIVIVCEPASEIL